MSRPKKSLGQNFLHDSNVARNIVESLKLQVSDRVLEIGPGKGALTSLLLERLDELTAVEIDDALAHLLMTTFGRAFTLIHDSVLNVDLHALAEAKGGKLRIVGNIPYNITSPILFWIIDSSKDVADCTIMMQREVALRLVAKPRTKEYGILSIFAQYYSAPELKFTVAPGSFYPVPDVTSAVVSLDFRKPHAARVSDDSLFRLIVRTTFGKRRKTLRNGLRDLKTPEGLLKKSSVDLSRRPEELSVADFVLLANELSRGGIEGSMKRIEPLGRP